MEFEGRLALLAVFLFGLTAPVRTIGDEKPRRLVCHYTTWSQGRAGDASYRIEDVPGELCTHLVYNFIGIDEDTFELTPIQREIDVIQNGYGRFIDLKKRFPHLRLSIAVGGWAHGGEKFSKMAARRNRRQIFVASVVKFLERYGFDGLELAWLYPGNPERGGSVNDKDNYIYLVEELSRAFQKRGRGWELAIQGPADKSRLGVGYEIDALCDAVDFVHLLGYDMRGSWNNFADIHSPMADRPHDTGNFRGINIPEGVKQWTSKGCPPGKLVLGVPMFGRTFILANPQENALGSPTKSGGPAGRYTHESGYLSYFEICLKFKTPRAKWRELWDDVGLCPYAYFGREWIGYENTRSVAEKVKFVKERQLAGMYAFSLDLDDYRGDCGGETYPLTKELYKYIEETKDDGDIVPVIDREWETK
ncbi:endochitinase-like [Toxorhynchites rutilus septentrionalis]|uniref:endochitinase-like n=1 Tax=Toxorhynchites rutilus septentrionalis TaxID=329112 RepID=UPI00247AD327|nr:endochitinase-like [Toxorhynchites rutilus septentrionalis]